MNKIYKVIWSKVKNQYVVVSELAHSDGKQNRTSRNSIRSRIAALVICGAITAFGVYGSLPITQAFAGVGETTSGQYIAVAVDDSNNHYGNFWDRQKYQVGDTRTFEDAQGKEHEYTYVRVDGKDYWVRKGYTITIEEGSRFTAYDQYGKPIAPNNQYIIDSQKSNGADSDGLISSSQVVISEDSAHTTLTGKKLNNIDSGIYGGAVNTSGTEVSSEFNYYIDDNGSGWKDVGGAKRVSKMGNFKEVYQLSDGTYNTDESGTGTTISTKNLYVIDGVLGAFFNSNGSVYTGNVYGQNNEVLMTGVDNGTYYSYWGTEIKDPNTSLSEMTVGNLNDIVNGINSNIYTAQGDDIKQVSVQKSGDNSGTIGLIRRGEWNGTSYDETDPVPGTITVTSTGGTGGSGQANDVKINFSNEAGSFDVDAGSKVEAVQGSNGKVSQIKINGVDYQLNAGGVIGGSIDSEGNVNITQDGQATTFVGKVQDWNVTGGFINKEGKLELTTQNAYGKETKEVTIDGVASTAYVDEKDGLNVKYDSKDKTSVTLGGSNSAPVKLTNVANGELSETSTDAVNGSQLAATNKNVENISDKVNAGWTAKVGDNEINVTPESNTLKFEGDKNIAVTADTDTINVELNDNITLGEGLNEIQINGAPEGDDPAFSIGNNFEVKQDGSLTAQTENSKIALTETQATVKVNDNFVDVNNANVSIKGDQTSVDIGENGALFGYANEDDWGYTEIKGGQILTDKVVANDSMIIGNTSTGKYINVDGSKGTITGLSNITWDADSITSGQAATEDQLQQAISGVATEAGKHTTVSGDENITVNHEDNSQDYQVTLNKDLTVDSVNAGGTIINSAGLSAGAVKVNAKEATVTGLSNTTWNKDNIVSGQAATEDQLQQAISGVETEAGKHTTVSGDENITVNHEDNSQDYQVTLNKDLTVDSVNAGGTIISSAGLSAGAVKVNAKEATVTGLSNTKWNDKIANVVENDKNLQGMAATQGQLEDVYTEAEKHTTVELADKNLTLEKGINANGGTEYTIGLSSVVALNGDKPDGDGILLNGEAGTIHAINTDKNIWGDKTTTNTFDFDNGGKFVTKEVEDKTFIGTGTVTTTTNISEFDEDGATFTKVKKEKDTILGLPIDKKLEASSTNIDGGTITISSSKRKDDIVINGNKGTITGLSNTTWNGITNDESRAATEGQLKDVSDRVDAGWIATDSNGSEVNINPDNNKLNFAGDKNINITATTDENGNNAINVKLNENLDIANVNASGDIVTINENGDTKYSLNNIGKNTEAIYGTKVNGEYLTDISGTLAATTIQNTKGNFIVDESGNVRSGKVFISGEAGDIRGLSNTTWDPDNVVEYRAATEGQLQQAISGVATEAGKHTTVSGDDNFNITETTNDNGGKNYEVALKDTIAIGTGDNQIKFDGSGENENAIDVGYGKFAVKQDGSLSVGDKFSVDAETGNTIIAVNDGTVMGNNTTMTVDKDGVEFAAYGNGTTVINGQTISAGGVIINENGSGTITGLTNTTWDADNITSGQAATEDQLQQAVNGVAEIANAGWTASDGTNNISIKPNETLNFVGDENLTVTADGTNKELQVSLNDHIVLGEEGGQTVQFDSNAGVGNDHSFMMYATNSEGVGIFGLTSEGTVHASDFISHPGDVHDGENITYSLNDIGDIVTQIAHDTFVVGEGENAKEHEYTVIADFKSQDDQEDPFNGAEPLNLAVRDDGTVIVGAKVDAEGHITDSGIRINEGNEDGTNSATITGLSNTEWKPPTTIATLAEDDDATKIESTAATQGQLNDLYGTVAAYNVNADGSVNYGAITLGNGQTTYNATTHTGGTIINNVGYAITDRTNENYDGSAVINADALNDAIGEAVSEGGAIAAENEKHLDTSTSYKPNSDGNITIAELDGSGKETGNELVIDNVASKDDIKDLNDKIGSGDFSGTNHIDKDTNNLTDAIKDLDGAISDMQSDVLDQVENSTVTGGHVDKDGNVILETGKDGNKSNVETDIKLTDSEVVGGNAENGKLTINKKDNYTGAETSVDIEGVATTDMVGAENTDKLKEIYKDADKDGNATTAYISDKEVTNMAQADVALDHAIQNVDSASYNRDMALSNRIDGVEKRLGDVEERIDKVGAMAAAIANLRTMGYDPEAPTEIAVGIGQYKSETGIAIGIFHYPNQDFMLSASISNSGDELMAGIGATWKLGRKSAAERAKDEEARHLEKAEEMKKLAQQEKVKAQAQRHAKLLEERQHLSQKKA